MTSDERPSRPSVPPACWFALAMWAGCVVAEDVSWRMYCGSKILWSAVAVTVALCAVTWGLAVSHRRSLPKLAMLGLVAGLAVSGVQGWSWHRQASIADECGAREWTGYVEADPAPSAHGSGIRVRLVGGPLDGARVRVWWPSDEASAALGRTVRFSAVMELLPAEEAWSRRVARGGVCATGTAWKAQAGSWRPGASGRLFSWRSRVLQRMKEVGGAGGDLLEGIVLGDRRRLANTPADEDFRVLGLTHLVAVSGSHLALACGAVALIGRALGLRRRPLIACTLVAGAAYALVTGMAYSALRSLAMLAVAAAAQLAGRRNDGLGSLAFAVICVLAIEPWSVHDIGFQLSVLAVGGLLAFGSLATAWAQALVPRMLRPLMGVVALTVLSQAITAPVVVSCFGMVSLLAPLANAYAGPMVTVALWTGLGGSIALEALPVAGMALLRFSAAVLDACAWISARVAALPGAAVALTNSPMVYLAVCATATAAWILWPLPGSKRSARRLAGALVACTLAAALGPAPARNMSVVALDVGQGDAILVRDGGRSMLVDCGPDPVSLRRALARYGLRRVDVLVLTHAHDDHTGGLQGLTEVAEIGWIGVPGVAYEAFVGAKSGPVGGQGARARDGAALLADGEANKLEAGDAWRVGDTLVTVLWPPEEPMMELATNDTSVVLHVSRGGFDAVLCGDAEEPALFRIAENGGLPKAEVLKVPHHGSDNGLTAEALAEISPSHAIISVGERNDFGHPSTSVLAMLHEAGCRVWRTDRCGDIEVRVGAKGYVIETKRHGRHVALRARIKLRPTDEALAAASRSHEREAPYGGETRRGTEARLPYLRRGGLAARARSPTLARPGG